MTSSSGPVRGARNRLINVDEMTEAEIDQLEADLRARAAQDPSTREG